MSTTRASSPASSPVGRPERFDLPGTGARMIRGEARVVPGAKASVVLVHGFKGFARFAFFPYLADRLAAAGLTAISYNSSGSGIGEDMETFTELDAFAENTYARELQDLALVLAEGKRRGWIGERCGLFGHSRGGAVALLEAARDARVGALVTWSAIASVLRWSPAEIAGWRERGFMEVPNARTGQILRMNAALLEEVMEHHEGRYDLLAAAASLLCPWLIVHGDADETVPFTEGMSLYGATEGRAGLLRIGGAGHTFNVSHGMTAPSPQLTEAVEATVRFLTERLGERV